MPRNVAKFESAVCACPVFVIRLSRAAIKALIVAIMVVVLQKVPPGRVPREGLGKFDLRPAARRMFGA